MEFLSLLISTIKLRPYVFAYLGLYLVVGCLVLGAGRTLAFTFIAYFIAFASEYSSTRTGFPYGLYYYTGLTEGEELFISNVPFMDSLSYTFLAFFSYSLALMMVTPVKRVGWGFVLQNPPWHSRRVLLLSGLFIVLQDVLIDPVAVRGAKWFLGLVHIYPNGGIYFGVPLSNFAGWLIVGLAIIYCFQLLDKWLGWAGNNAKYAIPGPVCYFINMVFILCVTVYVGEYLIFTISLSIFGLLLYTFILKIRRSKQHKKN